MAGLPFDYIKQYLEEEAQQDQLREAQSAQPVPANPIAGGTQGTGVLASLLASLGITRSPQVSPQPTTQDQPPLARNPSGPPTDIRSGPQLGSDIGDPAASHLEPVQKALLNAIAAPESGGKYDVRYTPQGGARFSDMSKHPGIFEDGPAGKSSAAGRYQMTKTTWDRLGGGDMSPEWQDSQAWKLAEDDFRRKTGKDLTTELQTNGLSPTVLSALGGTWAGLKANPALAKKTFNTSLSRYQSAPATDTLTPEDRALEAPQADGSPDTPLARGGLPAPDIRGPFQRFMNSIGAPGELSMDELNRYPLGIAGVAAGVKKMSGAVPEPTADMLPLDQLPMDVQREAGTEKLRRKFKEEQGLDYLPPGTRYNDTPTMQQQSRDMRAGKVNKGQLKILEGNMEDDLSHYNNTDQDWQGTFTQKKLRKIVDTQPKELIDKATKSPEDCDADPNCSDTVQQMAKDMIVKIGSVTPLPITPGPNAGRASVDDTMSAYEQSKEPGSNITMIPKSTLQGYAARRATRGK